MRFRRTALPFWAAVTILWLGATAIMAGSEYANACFADQVKLQQQAKDIRAIGGDPLQYHWGDAIQLNGFTVPAVQQTAPYFWQIHGKRFGLLAASLPITLLIVIETLARLLEGVRDFRTSRAKQQADLAEPVTSLP